MHALISLCSTKMITLMLRSQIKLLAYDFKDMRRNGEFSNGPVYIFFAHKYGLRAVPLFEKKTLIFIWVSYGAGPVFFLIGRSPAGARTILPGLHCVTRAQLTIAPICHHSTPRTVGKVMRLFTVVLSTIRRKGGYPQLKLKHMQTFLGRRVTAILNKTLLILKHSQPPLSSSNMC